MQNPPEFWDQAVYLAEASHQSDSSQKFNCPKTKNFTQWTIRPFEVHDTGNEMKIGILGGGVTGITLHKQLKLESEVLEASSKPGGLCRTYFKDGFGYDIGGHILFTKRQEVDSFVLEQLEGNLNFCQRANKIYFNRSFIKYPFEDNYECLIGYLKNNYDGPVENLKQWSYKTFGKGITEKYFVPYNEKIWNCAAEELSLQFVERIPKPPEEDVIKSSLGISTEGYLHQLNFKYPANGGIEALVASQINDSSQITTNFKISNIVKRDDQWIVSNGQQQKKYDKIILSFPIHEAIHCFEGVPVEVQLAVDNLVFNSISIVFIAVNNESLMNYSAVYIPDKNILPHRLCYMGYFSKNLVRPGTSSLIAEITTNPGDGIHELSNEDTIDRVIDDLDREGFLQRKDVIVTDIRREKYAYPVYNHTYLSNLQIVTQYFESIGVDLCGRFAQFEYINSDECIRRALLLANEINQEFYEDSR
jgi:protoporphyrinogen oxidase